ncbi:SCO2400 family protein [Streptomyces sp. UG1]|uniref:SCO2400 family protein n=1 Tax=Streptomyces sp. UG1 TaxID=3417652 RepID=UPI003CF996EA
MDYCSSCRRHLNGALVCPGCGAYAPDIAPFAAGGATVSAAPGPRAEAPAVDTWYDGYFRDEPAPRSTADETAPVEDVEGAPAVAPMGRAARRRQRARWKKNQRRAVVATAVALVGGGLTVSAMNQRSGDKAQAATAPERPDTGLPEQGTEFARPASTPPDTHKSPRTTTPSADPTPTNAGRESVTTPRTTRHVARPDAAATPTPTAPEAPRTRPNSPDPEGANSGDSTGGEAAAQQTPAPTPSDNADSGASPAPTSPAPEATSPEQEQLCVLNLVCLG